MTIKDAENKYLTAELKLIDWLNQKFHVVFKSNDGMCEFFTDGVLCANEIKEICDAFRRSVFTYADNTSYNFEKVDFNSDDDIAISVAHGNRISDIRNFKMSYKYDFFDKFNTAVNETLADLIVCKKDLIKAAYELECKMYEEINNYWKTKLLKI